MAQREPFIIFKNYAKVNNPKGPDWIGRGNVEWKDQLYPTRIAGWNKHTDKAGDFISLDIEIEGEGIMPEADTESTQSGRASSPKPAKVS